MWECRCDFVLVKQRTINRISYNVVLFSCLTAAVFIVFGLSGVVPAIHYVFVEGWFNKIALASLGWLSLMGSLYIIGALIYVMRIPERFFPGKCDIWVNKIFLILLN